jgi:hypothetical protein
MSHPLVSQTPKATDRVRTRKNLVKIETHDEVPSHHRVVENVGPARGQAYLRHPSLGWFPRLFAGVPSDGAQTVAPCEVGLYNGGVVLSAELLPE